MSELKELMKEFDFEQWLDTEGISYRRGSRTSKGREVNIRECPCCKSSKWKVYFNLTTGLGKCFAGDHPEEVQFNKLNFIKYHTGESWRGLQRYIRNELMQQGCKKRPELRHLRFNVFIIADKIYKRQESIFSWQRKLLPSAS